MGFILNILAQVDTGLPEIDATNSTITTAFNLALGASGAICVLIVTIAGVQYVLSMGDPQKTAKAKNTIIYALVGLVIVMMAFAITRFIVGEVA